MITFSKTVHQRTVFPWYVLFWVLWLTACTQVSEDIPSTPNVIASPTIQVASQAPITPTVTDQKLATRQIIKVTQEPTATPTPLPPTATATTSATSTSTPSPTPTLPACLPKEEESSVEKVISLSEAKEQAAQSDQLPEEGAGIEYQLSYDQRILFINWDYSMDRGDLLAYNLIDNSVQDIARLAGKWAVSPTSDCIILFGAVKGEDRDTLFDFDRDVNMIDSQGQVYRFEIESDDFKPDDALTHFAWSPDGLQIVMNNRIKPDRERLYMVSVDGSDVQTLFANENQEVFGVTDIDWSPSGEYIAVGAWYSHENDQGQFGIFLFDIETRDRILLVEDIISGQTGWSSDGQSLYFLNPKFECQQIDVKTETITPVEKEFCGFWY